MTAISTPLEGCPSGLAPPTPRGAQTDFSAFVRTRRGANQLTLTVRGAKCGGCIARIEKTLLSLQGVTSVRLNLSTGRLRVVGGSLFSANAVANAIAGLGYGVSANSADEIETQRRDEERKLVIAMGVAGFAAANIMLLSVSVWGGAADMGDGTRQAFHIISGLIAFPVIVFSGQHFFTSAWAGLKHRAVNMDVPITLAVWLAFFTSVWETARGGQHAYFDACVMLLFFLLIGRFLDARLRRRAYAAAHDLAALQNQSVTRLTKHGAQAVRADAVTTGDRLLLAPGERAVVDMDIVSGQSDIDDSLVTGETLPRTVMAGARVYSGSINLGNALEGIAVSPAEDSLLADITSLLEAGEQQRSAYLRIADRAVALYVPFVHITALLAFIAWLVLGASIHKAVLVAVSALIITCPCALALAAPVSQVVASSRLFRNGVFLKSGDALERLAEVDHVVFDKTGTLTLGTPVLQLSLSTSACLHDAARLARASRHPLSVALAASAGPGAIAPGTEEFPGQGLSAFVDGEEHRLGSLQWVGADITAPHTGPVLYYRAGDAAPVAFTFSDTLQDGAVTAIEQLRAAGLSVELLSGDTPASVQHIAERLNIEVWRAGARPQAKAQRLESLKVSGRKVLMIGDGLNDAAALSLAHAALSPGGAMEISQSASDAVYSGPLEAIPHILRTAKLARANMVQNFTLAAAYNLIAVPVAVTGHVTPLLAAIAMSASSLIVTLNALRMGLKAY